MRKGVLVLVLLALALVVAGCQGGKSAVSSSSTPFIGGSEGLRVSFVDNAPPTEVLDNPVGKTTPGDKSQVQRFDVILKVENVGEQDVATGNIKTTIGGIYPADFDKLPTDLQNVLFSAKLPAVTKLVSVKKDPDGAKIPGDVEELAFKDLAYLKQLEGNAEFPIQSDVCYRYATKAVGDFCMRQDLTRSEGGVCQAKGTKSVFSSGSPVQVSSFDESVGGRNKVILKFGIKTVGSGSFFKPEAIGTTIQAGCDRGNFAKENFVRVTINSGVTGLTCSGFTGTPPTGEVRLTNDGGTITCIQDGVNVDAIQKVNLQIEYNHLISASTKILVKHLPGFDSGSRSSLTQQQQDQANQANKANCVSTDTPIRCTKQQVGMNGVEWSCPGTKSCTDAGTWSDACTDTNDFCPITSTNIYDAIKACEDPASKGKWNTNTYTYGCICPNDRPNYQYSTGRCDVSNP